MADAHSPTTPPNQRTLVMKFGGTSVGTPEAMTQAVEIVRRARQDWPRLVVVTSALSGVTNLLLNGAQRAAGSDGQTYPQGAAEMRDRHHRLISKLVADHACQLQVRKEVDHLIQEFNNLCGAIQVLGEASPRALDAVASLGERMCIRVLAAAIASVGLEAEPVEASRLIVTDDLYQAANPDYPATERCTHEILNPLLDQGRIPIVTGFIGATPAGMVTTIGRGGSDFSAAILGSVLPADEVWIWTDVDGVMTADPRLVPAAKTIPVISYREISELAYFGAKVLHPKSIRPVIEAGIGLRVLNTFNPEFPGTRLVLENGSHEDGVIKAVTAIRGLKLITVEGRGMLGVPGVAARTFGAVAASGVSVPLITQASSEQSICFAIPAEYSPAVLSSLQKSFAHEIERRDIDQINASDEVVIITVVGAGMRHTPGVSGRIFSALGREGVNVIAIAQGSSEVSISLVVDPGDIQQAVRCLHELTAVSEKGN
ncbi:MAG TPA: aspartate kinase [Anaerolineaceae bacterium]|nr:aspartate kinase [Anaerolineaceae bacterium]